MAYKATSFVAVGGGSSVAIAAPGGTVAGDLVEVALYLERNDAITPHPGFTQVSDLASGGGRMVVFWARLTAPASGSWTFSWSFSTTRAAVAVVHSGRIASGSPFDGTPGTATGSGTATAAVSANPASSGGDAVYFAINFAGGSWTPPSGYTERRDDPVITVATKDAIAAGSTGSVRATCTGSGANAGWLGVLAAPVASGVTGSGAATADQSTATGSGGITIPGDGSLSATPGQGGGSGSVALSGSGAATSPEAAVAGEVSLGITGSGSATASEGIASGTSGTPTVTGSGAASAAPSTADGAGSASLSGSGSATLDDAQADGAGDLIIEGQGAATAWPPPHVMTTASLSVTGGGAAVAPAGEAAGVDTQPRDISITALATRVAVISGPSAVKVLADVTHSNPTKSEATRVGIAADPTRTRAHEGGATRSTAVVAGPTRLGNHTAGPTRT